ncbi:hypothetical protein [Parasitella parasitica]|uniref:Histidine kinase n=1 Tax=Parasitella parasitica TaxID=35722 RepID=A0A0B7NLG4_9FUNG|nr:hypothetical protein [Parasitella parasitica]
MSDTNHAIQDAISTIYNNCFSEVSDAFLEKLVKEIALSTGVQTVMIQRLLTKRSDQHDSNSESCEKFPVEIDHTKYIKEYMFMKACYSNVNHSALTKHSAVPTSYLLPDSPHIQTIYQENYTIIGKFDLIYPKFQTYVGIRLDEDQAPVGLISVMDDRPLTAAQLDIIQKVLSAVKARTKNEIERARQREQLVMVKNAAIKDAQGKIKFLADMSHEIRTPMNAVIALTDLLLQERNLLNEEQSEHLEVIQTSGNHLLTVINDILDISKINHDPKFKLEQRRFSIRKCVKGKKKLPYRFRRYATHPKPTKKDALNMARHQASMIQQNKLICVTECPPDVDDNTPLIQLINQLELNPVISHYDSSEKTVLPLLWKIDADVPDYLTGDSMRITQILLNLCSNAVKFTKKGGIRVKISIYAPTEGSQKSNNGCKCINFKERYDAKSEGIHARDKLRRGEINNNGAGASYYDENTGEDGGATTEEDNDASEKVTLEISVTDTGIGMPADRLPRLFKSFSQIDISTARRYGGTGLGLAISSMLVNRMGGGLWVESEEGLGSRFALTIPLSVSSKRPSSITTSSFGQTSESASSGMIASPPSPSSSVSDGGSSVGEQKSNIEANGNIINTISSSPSNSTGYFTNTKSTKHNNAITSFPWENAIIPSTPSPPFTLNNQDNTINTSSLNLNSANSSPNTASNKNGFTMNVGKGLQSMLSRLHDISAESSKNNLNNTTTAITMTDNNIITDSTIQLQRGHAKQQEPNESKSANSRMTTVSKHNRKSQNNPNEENFAPLYSIKILLAEDNVLNQKIAVSILKRLGFQNVIIASNGREALELMRVHTFDVIFMDLYMPEMDGLEATRHIISERKHNVPPPPILSENAQQQKPLLNAKDVYIIALTASASKQDRQICIDAGMNDFISKPFTMMEMRLALKNCASKRKKRKNYNEKKE